MICIWHLFSNDIGVYYQSPIRTNCLVSEIVFDGDSCKVASQQLGLSYNGRYDHAQANRPIGCHFYGYISFINPITNISLTKPSTFGSTGGICKVPGIICIETVQIFTKILVTLPTLSR